MTTGNHEPRTGDRSSSGRWRRRKEARPQEIVDAALGVFAERGYAATRMDDVAKRAGVTKGTLYLYFPNKEELFKAVIRGTLVKELMRITGIAGSAPVSIDSMIADFERLVETPVGALPKLVLGEAANFPEIARYYLDEVVGRGLEAIRGVLRREIDAGNFRKVDVEHAAYCVVAPLLLALMWKHSLAYVADRPLDIAKLCRAHLDLLRNGLAAAG
ncbi:MAG: TetR/AcrR family transcriptional regulator, partial [Stellaceae bacterium]